MGITQGIADLHHNFKEFPQRTFDHTQLGCCNQVMEGSPLNTTTPDFIFAVKFYIFCIEKQCKSNLLALVFDRNFWKKRFSA